MRLGFFSTEYFRKHLGMAESDRELCRELARIGYDVRAVVEDRRLSRGEVKVEYDGPVRLWRYQLPKFHVLRPRSYADKLLKMVFGDPRVASLLAIYGRFIRENPDLDLLQVEAPFPEGALVALVARRARKPFVVSARGWETLRFPGLRYRGIRWTLRQANAVRPNALNMAQVVVERFGVDPCKVRVIRTNLSRETGLPAGSDLGAFRQEGREALRRRTGLGHRFLLVAAARFVPAKGLEDLLPALRTLHNQGLEVGLILCGDGILRQRLQTRVAKLDLQKDVAFAGSIPHTEMLSALAGADLLVIPALLDWTPRVAVEAAAVGTPSVLTSGVGCAPWMVEAGAARVVPPGLPDSLADAIGAWLDDPEGRAEAGRRAVAWAGTFAVEAVAKKLSEFHHEVLGTYAAGGRDGISR